MAGRRSCKTGESFLEKRAIPRRCRKSAIRNLQFEINRRLALDIFAGSHGTGTSTVGRICDVRSAIPNQAQRGASAFRFMDERPTNELATLSSLFHSDELPVELNRQQRELTLMENVGRSRKAVKLVKEQAKE